MESCACDQVGSKKKKKTKARWLGENSTNEELKGFSDCVDREEKDRERFKVAWDDISVTRRVRTSLTRHWEGRRWTHLKN